ncbi:MAG: hypothetical protein PVI51_08025, partial [candidate division WOR-3 bacterium]
MTIFLPLYLKLSQKRFRRPFKPLGVAEKQWYLISVPDETKRFFQAYPFIFRLSKIGSVVLLMPKNLEHIRSLIKP